MSFLPLPESFLRNMEGHSLYASFSGGADSTALVLALFQAKIPFTAVHFNHGIRSAETGRTEQAFCRNFCAERNIPFIYRELNVPVHIRNGESTEVAARRCRMEAWGDILKGIPDAAILTAHHKDDARENLLIRLFRGGNVSSLVGLREKMQVGALLFLRPLLAYTKDELKSFLRNNGIALWMEDATNQENICTRNFFRNKILPEICETLSFASGGLNAAMDSLADDAAFLEDQAEKLYRDHAGQITCTGFWRNLPSAMMIRLLRRFLQERVSASVVPDRSFFLRFASLVTDEQTMQEKKLSVPGTDFQFLINKEKITVQKTDCAVPLSVQWDYRRDAEIRFCNYVFRASPVDSLPETIQPTESFWDADQLPDVLTLAVKRDGDVMTPFGHRSPVKVKKIFCDSRVAESERLALPLLRDEENILWIPGVKRSAFACCTPQTKKILRFNFSKLSQISHIFSAMNIRYARRA